MASCKKKNECKTKYKKKNDDDYSEDECKITRKRKNDDDDDCKTIKYKKNEKIPTCKEKEYHKRKIVLKYLQNYNEYKETKEDCNNLITIKKYNLISVDEKENIFPKEEIFVDRLFKELQKEEMKDCFHMININYILNFNTLSNGISSFKLGEIEIKPELIKTAIRFSIIQINNDEKNIDNIKKNIIEENNSNITILFERTVELKYGSTNHPFSQHLIDITWNIDEDWGKEKLDRYYWVYQIVRPQNFSDNLNFGIKDLENKIIRYDDGTNNDIKEEMKSQFLKIQNNFMDQIMNFKNEMCSELIHCQKKN